MCGKHYQRWRVHGDALYTRPTVVGVAPCSIDGCEKVVKARGLCSAHWTRWKRTGSATTRKHGEIVDGRRLCPSCGVDKALAEWTKGAECKTCARARAATYRAAHPASPRPTHDAICDYCGEHFEGTGRRWRYCSTECGRANRNTANWKHLNTRRARMREAFVEAFDRFEIFERDEWICQLCGDPIDRSERWPSGLSASLDHILPIARGGKHERSNAQAAHLTCNVRKGASVEGVAA